jgi:hypothetical protein
VSRVLTTCELHAACVRVDEDGTVSHVAGSPRVDDAPLLPARRSVDRTGDLLSRLQDGERRLGAATARLRAVQRETAGLTAILEEAQALRRAIQHERKQVDQERTYLAASQHSFRTEVTQAIGQAGREIARAAATAVQETQAKLRQLATDGEEYRRRVDDLGRTVEEIRRLRERAEQT